ncbi:MAG: hypothetical protein RL017_759 [Pseudomonadota bacterium]|jgi:hypothetical protein
MNKSKVTDEIKTAIMELSQQGQTIRNSATIIKEKYGISISKATVANVINRALNPTIQRKVKQVLSKEVITQQILTSYQAIECNTLDIKLSQHKDKIHSLMDNNIGQLIKMSDMLTQLEDYTADQIHIIKSEDKVIPDASDNHIAKALNKNIHISQSNRKINELDKIVNLLLKLTTLRQQLNSMLTI